VSHSHSLSTKPHKYKERLQRSLLAEPITQTLIKNFNLEHTEYGNTLISSMILDPRYDGIEYMYFLDYSRKERLSAIKELLDCDKKYFLYYKPEKLKRKFQHKCLRFTPVLLHDMINVCWFSLYKVVRLLYRKIKYS
jgi:hypothetical protein